MLRREEIEAALFEAESHVEAATAERDRLLRHYGAELGLKSERKVAQAWEELKAARAGTGEAPDAGKVAYYVGMVSSAGSADAIDALLETAPPAVRECGEVRAAAEKRRGELADPCAKPMRPAPGPTGVRVEAKA